MKTLLSTFIFACVSNLLLGQSLPMQSVIIRKAIFKEDLTKEMRYAKETDTANDRGIEAFKSDMNALIAQMPEVTSEKILAGLCSITCFFSTGGKLGVKYFSILPLYGNEDKFTESDSVGLRKCFDRLIGQWKPAESDGKAIATNFYRFSLEFFKSRKSPITISSISVSPTSTRSRKGLDCFNIYAEGDEFLGQVFKSVETDAIYIGGLATLAADINALLGTIRSDAVDMRAGTCKLPFLVNRRGHFARMDNQRVDQVIDSLILENLKMLSCNWQPAVNSGRPLTQSLNYVFNYRYKWEDDTKTIADLKLEIIDIKPLKSD